MDFVSAEISNKLLDDINEYVENYLDSFERQLSEPEQYAAILMAYDMLIKKCIDDESNSVDIKIVAEHFGDEIVKKAEEDGIGEAVKEIYIKGF